MLLFLKYFLTLWQFLDQYLFSHSIEQERARIVSREIGFFIFNNISV